MSRLDEMTGGTQTAESPSATPAQPVGAEQSPRPSLTAQIEALDLELDKAVDAGNEAEVRRLIQQGKELARAEKAAREREFEGAQAYFDEALKEYGESGEETLKASKEVADWRTSLQGYDTYIAERDKYYDDILANMHTTAERTTPQQEAPVVAAPAEPKEKAKSLDELLKTLDAAEAAYRAKLEEIKAEKKSVAARLVDERIAKLKHDVGA